MIAVVDINLHRERMLPSEKAFAYKMKMEAMKAQGKRTDLTLSQQQSAKHKAKAATKFLDISVLPILSPKFVKRLITAILL